jgi:hypothetical protein
MKKLRNVVKGVKPLKSISTKGIFEVDEEGEEWIRHKVRHLKDYKKRQRIPRDCRKF